MEEFLCLYGYFKGVKAMLTLDCHGWHALSSSGKKCKPRNAADVEFCAHYDYQYRWRRGHSFDLSWCMCVSLVILSWFRFTCKQRCFMFSGQSFRHHAHLIQDTHHRQNFSLEVICSDDQPLQQAGNFFHSNNQNISLASRPAFLIFQPSSPSNQWLDQN